MAVKLRGWLGPRTFLGSRVKVWRPGFPRLPNKFRCYVLDLARAGVAALFTSRGACGPEDAGSWPFP